MFDDHADHDREGLLCIDCDACALQHTKRCDECVVTFVCSRGPGEALVLDLAEARALRTLARAGLIPGLRHVRRPAIDAAGGSCRAAG